MIAALEAEPAVGEEYQFWTFGYTTGDPIPYSAFLLRRSLDETRRRFDPDGNDPSFDRMVLVGHSMGGLLAKMMVVESGTRLWREVSERPFDELAGEPDDRNLFGQALLIKPLPGVRRVVFIATPHRGSKLNRGWLQNLGTRLVRGTEPVRLAYDRLIARNNLGFFKRDFRKGLPSSIEELEWDAPFLQEPARAGGRAGGEVPFDHRGSRRGGRGGAHRRAGELRERAPGWGELGGCNLGGALCQDHPDAIKEVRRVLVEHGNP